MISLLLPTRGRVPQLWQTVRGLRELASDADAVEICLAVDDDDVASVNAARDLDADVVRVGTRMGYARLHEYVNALAHEASGDWLMVWNDDATMRTRGWDDVIHGYGGRDVVLDPHTDHDNSMPLFPVIPTRYVRALGHLSLSPHCDSWWDDLSAWLEIRCPVAIEITHGAYGSGVDQTARESREGYRSAEFFEPELTEARTRDAAILRHYITLGGARVG